MDRDRRETASGSAIYVESLRAASIYGRIGDGICDEWAFLNEICNYCSWDRFVHSPGIVHRHIKSGNRLLDRRSHCLTDVFSFDVVGGEFGDLFSFVANGIEGALLPFPKSMNEDVKSLIGTGPKSPASVPGHPIRTEAD
jgi:serine/threonine protein kinase